MRKSGSLNIVICGTQVPFIRGGAEKLVETLSLKLKKKGHNVDTVMIPFQWYPRDNILRSALTWKLLDLTEAAHQKIDLLIATKFPSYFINHPNKVVWLVHQHRGAFEHYSTPYSPYRNTPEDNLLREKVMNHERGSLEHAKALFAISANVALRLEKYLGLKAESLYPPLYSPEKYYSSEDRDYILAVSRIEADKRIDLLVKSLPMTDKKIRVKIVGTGSREKELIEESKKLGVRDRIDFLGWVSENKLYDLYAHTFAVYFAPWDEDYGYITIEAFQSKKPVITSDQSGGVLEFVEHERTGIVTDGSINEIATAINFLYKNRAKRKEMGNEGFHRIQGITWERTIDRLLSTTQESSR